MHLSRREAGFTLVELLIAIIIGAVILVGVFQFFDSGLRVWKRIDQVEEPQHHLTRNLDLIASELENAFHGGSLTDFIGMDQQDPDSGMDSDALQFITADGGIQTQPGYDLKRVGYQISTDPDNPGLVKQVDNVPFQEPVTDASVPDDGQALLMHGTTEFNDALIRSLNFRYFDGTDWVDSWDSRAMGGMPQAVEVTLGIGDSQDPTKIVTATRTIRLNNTGALTPAPTGTGAGNS